MPAVWLQPGSFDDGTSFQICLLTRLGFLQHAFQKRREWYRLSGAKIFPRVASANKECADMRD